MALIKIRNWRNKMNDVINKEITELAPEHEIGHQSLRDHIYAWKSKGMNPGDGLELLKTAVDANRLKLSYGLNASINEILNRAMIQSTGHSKELKAVEDEEREEIKKVLQAQRITPEAYEDDGKRQAYALKQLILQGIIDNAGDTGIIDAVLKTKGQDTEALKVYSRFVQKLKEEYTAVEKVDTAISSVNTIEQCLKEVDSELERIRLGRLENREEATAYILRNFLDSIQDEKEIERIIGKYANVTAATCQQSMEVGRFAINQIYDLVIVEEAARANPLDLLIPVSMGKQVVLVGDHKQLPHMLDPDVVKQFENDTKMQELGVLQESLFERLFKMFSRSQGRVKRTARLSKQYRMHPIIGEFASDNFYSEYKLDSSEVKIEDKEANLKGLYNNQPMAWINLDKNHYGMETGRRSKKREKEAERIISEVKKVLSIDQKKSIGIISFYKSQSDYLEKIVGKELTDAQNDQIDIGTVDAFQGKEFDVVFLSCVRANVIALEDRRHKIGHIDDLSRLCVSFTRAKQLIVVVGDRETVECVPTLADFIRRCREGGLTMSKFKNNQRVMSFRNFDKLDGDIYATYDIAWLVEAVECYANKVADGLLDALAEAVLELLDVKEMTPERIASLLWVSDEIVSKIIKTLGKMEHPFYDEKKKCVTQAGIDYIEKKDAGEFLEEKVFGYMFVSRIDGEVFPYFMEGKFPWPIKQNEMPCLSFDEKKPNLLHGERAELLDRINRSFHRYGRIAKASKEFEHTKEDWEMIEFIQEELHDQSYRKEEILVDIEAEKKLSNARIKLLDTDSTDIYVRCRLHVSRANPKKYVVDSPFPENNTSWYSECFHRMIVNSERIYIDGEEKELNEFCESITQQFYVDFPEMQSQDFEYYVKIQFPRMLSCSISVPCMDKYREAFRYRFLCDEHRVKRGVVITEATKALELILNNYVARTKKEEIVRKYRDTIKVKTEIADMLNRFGIHSCSALRSETKKLDDYGRVNFRQSIMSHFKGCHMGSTVAEVSDAEFQKFYDYFVKSTRILLDYID